MNEMRKYTVLITGADRGLGFELAKLFLEHNYFVFAGRYLEKWNLLNELRERYPESLELVTLDVGSDESVHAAAEQIRAKTGSLDMIINVAAIPGKLTGSIFDELDFEDMLRCYNVTTLGGLRVVNALIHELMSSFHKLVVNISSEAGSIGTCWRYEGFGYCMAKASVNMQAAIIHNSLHRQFNGQVINVHPGGMQSHFMNNHGPDTPLSQLPPEQFLSTELSAKNIFDLIMDQERFKSDHPAFVNYRGDKIPW